MKKIILKPNLDMSPVLLVVVDTEEEFDWNAPPDPNAIGTSHIKALPNWQKKAEQHGIKPCYVTDYPIANNPEAMELLCNWHKSGNAELGAHCHPWVNPPIKEVISPKNTYPGNLTESLESEKIKQIKSKLENRLGEPLRVYKAGRYGFGPNTAKILTENGFDIDLSLCPAFDFRSDGGPDYRNEDPNIKIYENDLRQLMSIPLSSAHVGWGGRAMPMIDTISRMMEWSKMPGILSRIKIVDRLKLSPEGFSSKEHQEVTRFLFNKGIRVFSWTFHSPSLEIGHTPYVKTLKDLENFYRSLDVYMNFFYNELGGRCLTPTELKKELLA